VQGDRHKLLVSSECIQALARLIIVNLSYLHEILALCVNTRTTELVKFQLSAAVLIDASSFFILIVVLLCRF
jgi:hypothetical protein